MKQFYFPYGVQQHTDDVGKVTKTLKTVFDSFINKEAKLEDFTPLIKVMFFSYFFIMSGFEMSVFQSWSEIVCDCTHASTHA